MAQEGNYTLQMQQAKSWFLTYDQEALIQKHQLRHNDHYLYLTFLSEPHRLSRATGDLERLHRGQWLDANTHSRVMTLLDLLCDSREDRHLQGRLKSMQSFGLQFHENLLEDRKDPRAQRCDRDLEGFCRACATLGGRPVGRCDAGFSLPLFRELEITLQFWASDEDFPPRLRFLWDENALQYLRYETMYFAVNALWGRLTEEWT